MGKGKAEITESDPSKNKPYHWRPVFHRVVVADLPEGFPRLTTANTRFTILHRIEYITNLCSLPSSFFLS